MGRLKTRSKIIAIDPFEISSNPTTAQRAWAEWFALITRDVTDKFHIRRIHYMTLEKPKPDGNPYKNTVNDSSLLARASEYARYLGLVDMDAVEDHKNEGEVISVDYGMDNPTIDFSIRPRNFTHPEIDIDDVENLFTTEGSSEDIEFDIPSRRPFHLELWIEKSTLNDIVYPIAEKYGMSLNIAGGQFSVTNVKDMFSRIKNLEKPVRIFYLRDFDPSGQTMPTAVARKIEWFIRKQRPEIDLKLFDVALNYAQCVQYQLPRAPMDRNEIYKGNFEKQWGEGATELDALEALHPGELEHILDDTIAPYFDDDLGEAISDSEDTENEAFEEYRGNILREAVEAKREKLVPLINAYNEIIRQANVAGENINQLMQDTSGDYSFEANRPGSSDLIVDDEPQSILNTCLSYGQQLELYRENKAKKPLNI